MNHTDFLNDNKQIKAVTLWGVVTNIGLAIVKMIVGPLSGSMGLFADGLHSLSDVATDVAVLVGVHFSAKKPDRKHQYGHGRVETFASAFVAIVLIVVGCGMIYQASQSIIKMYADNITESHINSIVIWIALLSVLVKEVMYQFTKAVAVRTHCTALYANAWHHRTDAFSSVVVIIGAIAVRFGYPHGDQLAAVGVGLMIVLVGVKIISGCLHELAERAIDEKTLEKICHIIKSDLRIKQWHRLRTRSAGREIFVDLHILVDPQLKITEAHEIADALETNLHNEIDRPINVMVHVEPDTPQMRQEDD